VPTQSAPYGSWSSPITSDLIVSSSIGLGAILHDGTDVFWIESRPQEQGRSVVVRRTGEGTSTDITPPVQADGQDVFNVRTRVHEYGGGAYLVSDGIVYFCNDKDQRIYRQKIGELPVAITQPPQQEMGLRYADGVKDATRERMIWVREDHTTGARQPVNTLISIRLDGAGAQAVLQSGRDFYSNPRISPDGLSLAWLEWEHPNMPWIGCELWVGRFNPAGAIISKRLVAGGNDESVFQPEWSPDGVLYFISDRLAVESDHGRWWNLYRIKGDPSTDGSIVEAVHPLAAEFGQPQWTFRMSTYAFESVGQLICSYVQDAIYRMMTIDVQSLRATQIDSVYSEISDVCASRGHVYFRGGSYTSPTAIVDLEIVSGRITVLKLSSTQDVERMRAYISEPKSVTFPTGNGLKAHGVFYPPRNPDFVAPRGELPPLIVHSHGGPTAAASSTLNLQTQFWTSRGFAVLDVNYGGSTGYGREYRLRLQGQWGIVDVEDCVNGAKHVAEMGEVDGENWAVSGGSASGFTTLAALTFRKEFKTGASYYGVSDLEALAKDTHKFESHYLDGLVGPYPECKDLYEARSPIHSARLLSVPVVFFQGAEDKIVPPQQAEEMVSSMRKRGTPFLCLLFDGEQHGFRRAENIRRALDAELYFYATFLTANKLAFPAAMQSST
jgi:dipeptidyl aminopeptidase/acylaminoacyl peptidase